MSNKTTFIRKLENSFTIYTRTHSMFLQLHLVLCDYDGFRPDVVMAIHLSVSCIYGFSIDSYIYLYM